MNNTHTATQNKPVVLLVLDGWGYSENPRDNAILAANTPVWDKLWQTYPHTLIHGSGKNVGLPDDQMGNSEVGHLNLGAGRIVSQEYTRIDQSIRNGDFNTNEVLSTALKKAVETGKAVHIMGLLSDGGVHSHEKQIHAMVKMATSYGIDDIYLHAFLDGRDTAPKSAATSIRAMEEVFKQIGKGRIASLIGRYFAMDRDKRWARTEAAYELITAGKAEFHAESALAGLAAAYDRKETDEFVRPIAIASEEDYENDNALTINDGDIVIYMNFRADRTRQLTQTFIDESFSSFEREHSPKLGEFICLTEYKSDFDAKVAYPPQKLNNVFGAVIAGQDLKQLRIAETEKYAHVTFFFNGGEEDPFTGEDRIMVKSPKVPTYDLKPEMSAHELTCKLVKAISSQQYSAIICNYANPDMVGHSGKLDAAIKAIETIDDCLKKVLAAVLETGCELLITADHGNAEQMRNPETNQPHTAHTSNPVPFIYVGRPATLAESGALSDVSPTMLHILGIAQPAEMTGQSLIQFD